MSSEVEFDGVVIVDEVEEGEISDVSPSPSPSCSKELPARYRLRNDATSKRIHTTSRSPTRKRKLSPCTNHKKGLQKWIRQEISQRRQSYMRKTIYSKKDKDGVPVATYYSSTSLTMVETDREQKSFVSELPKNDNRHNIWKSKVNSRVEKNILSDHSKSSNVLKVNASHAWNAHSCVSTTKADNCKKEIIVQDTSETCISNSHKSDLNLSYEELLDEYKYLQQQLVILDEEDKNKNEQLPLKDATSEMVSSEIFENTKSLSPTVTVPNATTVAICESNEEPINQEDDDDAELKELRLRALASRMKSHPKTNELPSNDTAEVPENASSDQTQFISVHSTSEFLNHLMSLPCRTRESASDSSSKCDQNIEQDKLNVMANKENMSSNTKKFSSAYSTSNCTDNFDVLDMDESACDDTTSQAGDIMLQPANNDDQIDFEEQKMREQLLASMRLRKAEKEKEVNGMLQEENVTVPPTNGSRIPKHYNGHTVRKIPMNSDLKRRQVFFNARKKFQKRQVLPIQKRKVVYRNPRCTSQFMPSPFVKQKPVIISLGGDSSDSSEENSDHDDVNTATQAMIKSLKQLIESAKSSTPPVEKPACEPSPAPMDQPCPSPSPVPMDQPCPSPSPVPMPEPLESDHEDDLPLETERLNIFTYRSNIHEYTLLLRKLEIAEAMLVSENKILQMTQRRCNDKKSAFVQSQADVQRLQEQLNAAVKVKEACKDLMFEIHERLETIRNSVYKRAELINDLKKECLRLENRFYHDSVEGIIEL